MNPSAALERLKTLSHPARHSTPAADANWVQHLDLEDSDFKDMDVRARTDAEEAEHRKQFTFFSINPNETVSSPRLGDLLSVVETCGDASTSNTDEEAGSWWLDVFNPSPDEIGVICSAFRVHPLVCEEVTTHQTREKLEVLGSYYFLCLRSFIADKPSRESLSATTLYFVVFGAGLLSFSLGDNRHSSQVRRRISRLKAKDTIQLSADWICYAFIDEIVDDILARTQCIRGEIESIEDSIMIARLNDSQGILAQIHDCHKKINMYISLLSDKVDVIHAFAKRRNAAYSEGANSVVLCNGVGQYLSDVKDHVLTMLSDLADLEHSLENSHSIFLSQIKMQQVGRNKTFNKLLHRAHYLLALFMLLTLIHGLFTVNVPLPGENSKGLTWFFSIIGVMLTITVCFVLVSRRWRIFQVIQ